ncbi:LAFA_0G09758g1_1 [Lachancea sp. 'fantastica']|nr:LAFA_0G09758g1_1 [Lachancea sp. 'fantastica']
MSAVPSEEQTQSTGAQSVEFSRTIVDPETTIFVGNVARECEESDLQAVFGDKVEVEIPSAKNGKSFKQRYAFVKFPSKIDFDAIKAQYDKTVVKDRGIYIRRAQTEEERDAKRQARINRPRKQQAPKNHEKEATAASKTAVDGENELSEDGAAKSDRKPARSAIPAPPKRQEKPRAPLESMERTTDTLYVNNVPYMATREQVAEFFGTDPDLVVMPLRRMRNVKTKQYFYSKKMNRGIAFVTFKNCSDIAQKVTEFQGKSFNDRELAVDVAALKPANEEPAPQNNASEIQEPVSESTTA